MFMRLGFRPFTSFAKDHYKVLGVSANANKDEIKKAYLGLAKQYHPDTESGNEEKFKEIANSYQTLSNEQEKQEYDAQRTSNWAQGQYNSNQRTQGYGNNERPFGNRYPFTDTDQSDFHRSQQEQYYRKTRDNIFREQQKMYEQWQQETMKRMAKDRRKRQRYEQDRFNGDPFFSKKQEQMHARHAAAIIVRAIVATTTFVFLGVAFAGYFDRRRQPAAYPFATPHEFRRSQDFYYRNVDTRQQDHAQQNPIQQDPRHQDSYSPFNQKW